MAGAVFSVCLCSPPMKLKWPLLTMLLRTCQMRGVFGNLQIMYKAPVKNYPDSGWVSISIEPQPVVTSHIMHIEIPTSTLLSQTFTYLSRRYCDNRHPRTFLWRHFHSHGQFTRTTQRSPHFCDACTLTKPRGTCVQKTVLAVCIVPILSCLNVL